MIISGTKFTHKLLTINTCKCDKQSDNPCCVCDMGLAVCEWCGAAECELDDRQCTGPTYICPHCGCELQPTDDTSTIICHKCGGESSWQ